MPVVQIALLRSLPSLAELPAAVLERLASTLVPAEVPAGTVLIRPAAAPTGAFSLVLRVYDPAPQIHGGSWFPPVIQAIS